MVTWAGVGLHMGVTPRSQQGHLKFTARSNQTKMGENSSFLLQFCSLNEISVMVQIHLVPNFIRADDA